MTTTLEYGLKSAIFKGSTPTKAVEVQVGVPGHKRHLSDHLHFTNIHTGSLLDVELAFQLSHTSGSIAENNTATMTRTINNSVSEKAL